MNANPKIIIYGAGAIGCTLAAWLSEKHENTYLLCRGESAKRIKIHGVKIYSRFSDSNYKGDTKIIPINVIKSIDEVKDPDIIAFAVKNYSLQEIVKNLDGKINKKTILLGLQNGVSNQKLLDQFSSRKWLSCNVLFGILAYNAWLDEPGVVGYQSKGVMVIGSIDDKQKDELKNVAAIFNKGVETIIAKNWRNASHTKLLINLSNSLTSLLGKKFQNTPRPDLLQKILANMMLEGIDILKAEGIQEEKIKGLPSWTILKASAILPRFITAPLFLQNLKKMGMSSMAQDIFIRHSFDTELEDINGYMLSLAEKHNLAAPFNRAVYELCKEKFSTPEFLGMNVEDVWNSCNKLQK